MRQPKTTAVHVASVKAKSGLKKGHWLALRLGGIDIIFAAAQGPDERPIPVVNPMNFGIDLRDARDFATAAPSDGGFCFRWQGDRNRYAGDWALKIGVNGIDVETGRPFVPELRPGEVKLLHADGGWQPLEIPPSSFHSPSATLELALFKRYSYFAPTKESATGTEIADDYRRRIKGEPEPEGIVEGFVAAEPVAVAEIQVLNMERMASYVDLTAPTRSLLHVSLGR